MATTWLLSARSLIEAATLQPSPADEAAAVDELIARLDTDSDYDYVRAGLGLEDGEELADDAVRSWAASAVDTAWYTIQKKFNGEYVEAWRVITVAPGWKPSARRHPGVYWSWENNAAEAHWGNWSAAHKKVKMNAMIRFNDVDWPTTLALNAHPSYEEEKELRLKDHAPVRPRAVVAS